MVDTIRERIIQQFVVNAAGLSAAPVLRAQRSTGEGLDRFVTIWDGAEVLDESTFGKQWHRFLIGVEVGFNLEDDNPSVAANGVIGEIISQCMNVDRTFGGLARRLEFAGASPNYPRDGSTIIYVLVNFNVLYAHATGDPYTAV